VKKMGNDASLFLNIILVFSSMKIGKAHLRLKLKKYGNEATLVFSSMKIGKADLRLKWKKWEMFVLCIFIDENR
jgi:hypothetical protein